MLVLYGAGTTGRVIARNFKDEVQCFVDSNTDKHGQVMEGFEVIAPDVAQMIYPGAVWVATAISRPAATEIRAQLKQMGVTTKPLWECLNVCHGLPPKSVQATLAGLMDDEESLLEWCDQFKFRQNPDYDIQRDPSNCRDIYFPEFIKRRDDEVLFDCGAADGDTIKAFIERWANFSQAIAFEPDRNNYEKLRAAFYRHGKVGMIQCAVSDFNGEERFVSTGDYSAHLGGDGDKVSVVRLDSSIGLPPTFIKMDIEGSELEAIWGARRILKEHKPVLAICAYHTSDHLWQIPLLIHAIQPDYKLFLRRYAEGAFELVWYAVPPERMVGNQELQRRVMQELALGENE